MKLPKVTSQHTAESSVILAGKRDTHHFRQERMISVASCKRDTKSKSHPGMKLAPVRVFSCKHPLTCLLSTYISTVTAILGGFVLKTKYRKST